LVAQLPLLLLLLLLLLLSADTALFPPLAI